MIDRLNKLDKKIINKEIADIDNYLDNKILLKLFAEVDSTNNRAKDFIQREHQNKVFSDQIDLKDLIVFAADRPNCGRGRRGHSWFSNNSASLSVSFLFKSKVELNKIPQITAAAALAVQDSFNSFSLKSRIKWPNDIIIDDKKICGILSELVFSPQKEAFVIIGCGLNLNNESFEREIKDIATSYFLETNKKIDKNLFLAELIKNMNSYIESYFSSKKDNLIKRWKDELELIGKKIDLNYKNKEYTVIIKDITNQGELLISLENGEEKIIQSVNSSLDYESLKKYN